MNTLKQHFLQPHPGSSPRFILYLLGSVNLCIQSGSLIQGTEWDNDIQKALFIYLALNRDHPTTHSELQQQFGSYLSATDLNREITAVSQNLVRILNLPNPILRLDKGYQLHTYLPIWIDIDEFDKLLTKAANESNTTQEMLALQEAVSLYRDDFLLNIPFNQEWIASWRVHFQRGYLAALQKLSTLYEQASQLESAHNIYRNTLKPHSVATEHGRSFTHLVEANNSSAQSLRQCKRLISLLQNELKILLEEYSHPLDEADPITDRYQEGGKR